MSARSTQLRTRRTLHQRGETTDNIRTVTAAGFDDLVLHASGRVAVEFMSYGCVHCRTMEPVLQDVAESIAGTEPVVRVNVAIEQELADRYDIRGTPTFVMFLDGREVGRAEGPSPTTRNVLAAVTDPFGRLDGS